jgi:hypothetical protein
MKEEVTGRGGEKEQRRRLSLSPCLLLSLFPFSLHREAHAHL